LLAASGRTVRAYTFGAADSADMRVARRIAARLELDHVAEVTEPGALERALRGAVLAVDGMVGATHLHGSELLPRVADECSVVWNGFAGDAILGGSFSSRRYARTSDLAAALLAALRVGGSDADICALLQVDVGAHPRAAISEALSAIDAADSRVRAYRFLMRERVGRLASGGLAVDRHFLPVACPFANRPVVEQSSFLSGDERRGSSLYRRAIHRNHAIVSSEMWPRTGLSPEVPAWAALAGRARQRLFRRDQTVDYRSWMIGEWRSLRARTLGIVADALLG
jgi:hypothetical protein